LPSLDGAAVLVTGAAGFVGANLCRSLLARGASVAALVRPGSEPWRLAGCDTGLRTCAVDLADLPGLERIAREVGPRFVFHLAAGPHRPLDRATRLAAVQTDVVGTAHLLEALRPLSFERLVQLGSSLEYGPHEEPLVETLRDEPTTLRGATKAAATLLCQSFARSGRPALVLRPTSVYGPWEPEDRLVPTALRAALGDGRIDLTGPDVRRDMVYVDDVVEACLCALAAKDIDGAVINVGAGRQWSNEEIVAAVGVATGRTLAVRSGAFPRRVSDTSHWVAEIGKAKRLLGWEPRHDLASGIAATLAWRRVRPAAPAA
jgi:nucleoside-diphosphate-sugar epimerase